MSDCQAEGLTLRYILQLVRRPHVSFASMALSKAELTHDDIKYSMTTHQTRPYEDPMRTHFTAGANAFSGTIPNPAARTAADWRNAAATRLPTGMASMILHESGSVASYRGEQMYLRIPDIQYKEAHPIGHAARSSAGVTGRQGKDIRERDHDEDQEPRLRSREQVNEASGTGSISGRRPADGMINSTYRRGWSRRNCRVSLTRDPTGVRR